MTAHYDTCAALPIPNFLMPCNITVYVLYQIGITCGIILISVLLGVLAGLLLGALAVPLVCCLILCGVVGLMIFGPANKHNANDNTSGVVTVLEIMRTLQENQRHKVCFVLFDLEEAGLVRRTEYLEVPVRVEYCSTEKADRLMPVLEAFSQWGEEMMEE